GGVLADAPGRFPSPRPSPLRYPPESARLAAEVAAVLGSPPAATPVPVPVPAPAPAPAGAGAAGAGLRHIAGRWGPALAVLALVLAAWYAVSDLVLSPERRFLLPPPDAVVRVGFLDPAHLAELLAGLWLTAQVAAIGLAI